MAGAGTDLDGVRVTAFATNTARGQLADLELRRRCRSRAEDRIRCAKDTGLRNLPLHDFGQNQICCAIVALACELTTWMQLLAFTDADGTTHQARRWEPKRLRLRLFSTAARIARTGRRTIVHLARNGAWTRLLQTGLTRIHARLKTPHPVTTTRQQARPVEPALTRDDTRVLVLPDCKNQRRTPATKPRLPPRDGATKDPS